MNGVYFDGGHAGALLHVKHVCRRAIPDRGVQDSGPSLLVQRAAAGPAAGGVIGVLTGLQRNGLVAPVHQVGAAGVRPAAGPVPLAAACHMLIEAAPACTL